MADQQLKCPNCGSAVTVKADGTAVCGTCGGSFSWQAGEAKLEGVGELDALKADVDELKKRLPASTPAQEPATDPDREWPEKDPDDYRDPDPDAEDDDEDEDL
jgi:uncharacterized Zn finger protein (UPF0148 family)